MTIPTNPGFVNVEVNGELVIDGAQVIYKTTKGHVIGGSRFPAVHLRAGDILRVTYELRAHGPQDPLDLSPVTFAPIEVLDEVKMVAYRRSARLPMLPQP